MKSILTSFRMLLIMTLITGLVYPIAITGVARIAFPEKSEGSLVVLNGRVVGSELIGQKFSSPRYFHGRPSANGYDGLNSGGSNLGPTNRRLIDGARKRAERIREENGLAPGSPLPSDLVLASGSGLDPHISLGSVLLQVPRVARARGVDRSVIMRMAETACEKRYLNRWGDPYVNVLKLNRALDDLESVK